MLLLFSKVLIKKFHISYKTCFSLNIIGHQRKTKRVQGCNCLLWPRKRCNHVIDLELKASPHLTNVECFQFLIDFNHIWHSDTWLHENRADKCKCKYEISSYVAYKNLSYGPAKLLNDLHNQTVERLLDVETFDCNL